MTTDDAARTWDQRLAAANTASDDAAVEAANRAHWELLETEYRELSKLSGNEFTPEPWTGTQDQRDAVEPVSLVILAAVRAQIVAEIEAVCGATDPAGKPRLCPVCQRFVDFIARGGQHGNPEGGTR